MMEPRTGAQRRAEYGPARSKHIGTSNWGVRPPDALNIHRYKHHNAYMALIQTFAL